MTLGPYSNDAVDRAKEGAQEWLNGNVDGYPRSWKQEEMDAERRDYDIYDGLEAPPIAGYEALERDGVAVRIETTIAGDGQERVHFRLRT